MRARLLAALALGVGAAHGCDSSVDQPAPTGADCPPCVKDADCPDGSRCGQLGGDSYCAPDCSQGQACSADRSCGAVNTAEGAQASLCVLRAGVCGTTGATTSTASGTMTCGSLDGPDTKACCHGCGKGKPCQANGCYGGWWCNHDSCACQAPPDLSSCGTTIATTAVTSGGGGSSGIGPTGGKLDSLSFAVVGDTRPPTEDDLAGYPKLVAGKIWQDVQNQSPRPAFALTTGDYVFANPYKQGSAQQFDLYLGARAAFVNEVFPAMGNHECTGGTASNCGTGKDGLTSNYVNFLKKMLAPIGQSKPYYSMEVDANDGKWTSKFVFVAANAWDTNQSAWLDAELAKPTTYTFVVRHEPSGANQAPGVDPSDAIIAKYKYTLLVCGHTHTFQNLPSSRQMIVGNGGAPLSGNVNYGYVIARQRQDGVIELKNYDYATNAPTYSFALTPDGAPSK